MQQKHEKQPAITLADIHNYSQLFINDILANRYWGSVYNHDGAAYSWGIPSDFRLDLDDDIDKKPKEYTASFRDRFFTIKTSPGFHEARVDQITQTFHHK